jgi:hypothetical protein
LPSWRNELIEKDIRQKARLCRAFFFFALATRHGRRLTNSFAAVFLLGAILPHLKHGTHSHKTTAARCQHRTGQLFDREIPNAGYPEKKSRKASLR